MHDQKHAIDARALITLVMLGFLWGLSQIAMKVANAGVGPIFQAALRSIVASVLIIGWAHLRRMPLIHRDRTLWHGIAIGALFGTEFVFVYLGLYFTTASHAVILLYTAPLFVAFGAHWLLPEEPLTTRKTIGLVLAFAGLVATLWDSLGVPSRSQLLGDFFSLTAGLLWAATSLYIKRVVRGAMSPSQMLFYQLGFSAIQLSLICLLFEPTHVTNLSPIVLASLAYQGIIVAFASYLVWFWLVKVYPVSDISGFTFLTPIFGVLLGGVLLHDPLTAKLMLGGSLVVLGMILVNMPAHLFTRGG